MWWWWHKFSPQPEDEELFAKLERIWNLPKPRVLRVTRGVKNSQKKNILSHFVHGIYGGGACSIIFVWFNLRHRVKNSNSQKKRYFVSFCPFYLMLHGICRGGVCSITFVWFNLLSPSSWMLFQILDDRNSKHKKISLIHRDFFKPPGYSVPNDSSFLDA